MHKMTLLVLACLVVTACAVSRVDPLSVPLAYQTNPKNAGVLGLLSCNSISQVQVNDGRSDKTLGVRSLESKPLKADVSTASDPVAWVQSGVQGLLQQNGVVQGSGPKLLVTLDNLRTTESIWHRASYDARVGLTAQLQGPSGKACWKNTAEGTGGDYGYEGNVATYQGMLNSALDSATLHLVESPGFKDALCHCGD
jgi:hypothetical protein